jgi:hypothetical protein
MKSIIASAFAVTMMAGVAFAQTQGGLVNVQTGDIGVDALNNTTVQVPIGIAAQVCGVDANVIAKQRDQALTNCKVDQQSANTAFMNYVTKKNQGG